MIITRTSFCENCSRNQNPRTGVFFVVHGKTGWHVYRSQSMGKIGFVPVNYKLIKIIGENVVYEKLCSIHGCGMDVFFDDQTRLYHFRTGTWQRHMMELKTWNGLVQYMHDEDYFL